MVDRAKSVHFWCFGGQGSTLSSLGVQGQGLRRTETSNPQKPRLAAHAAQNSIPRYLAIVSRMRRLVILRLMVPRNEFLDGARWHPM